VSKSARNQLTLLIAANLNHAVAGVYSFTDGKKVITSIFMFSAVFTASLSFFFFSFGVVRLSEQRVLTKLDRFCRLMLLGFFGCCFWYLVVVWSD
jgi:hypothetical protein